MLQVIKDTNPLCKSAISEIADDGPWYNDTYLLKWKCFNEDMAWKSQPHQRNYVPNIVFD